MKVGKMLLFAVCLTMVAGIAQAKVRHGGKVAGDTMLVIPLTSIAPKIDGKVDQIWNMVDATWMGYDYPQGGHYPTDWSDISGWVKLMYDSKNIYGLFYVQDDVIDTTTTTDWQLDGIEFYIDANNTHEASSQLVPPKYQFNLRPAQKIDSAETAIGRGLKYKWFLDTASINNGGPVGYFVQFQFPLDSIGFKGATVPGKEVSMQFQLDDNDLTAAGRINVMNWWYSPTNQDYLQTLDWGNAIFSTDAAIDTFYVFLKTSTPPVIDGKLDPIWDKANQLTMDYVQPENGANPQDQSWRFYGLYDDKFIYGLYTVYDDIIDTTTTIDWQLDGVEFYTDPNNTHEASSQLVAPKYQTNLRPAQKIDSAKTAIGRGLDYKWIWEPGNPNDTVFSSMSHWQLEFKLSLDSLGFKGKVAEGNKFSFQLQTDDNDLTAAGRVHTANWWYSPSNQDYLQTLNWGNAKFGPIVTAVKQTPTPVATAFRLQQNYPNPFNPSTKISYSVDRTGFATLKVYNVLGQEVATLFEGVARAGQEYIATFDGSRFASGVYFYKLEAGNQMLVKKLMLLK